jgi:membrane-associated protein
MTGLLDHLLNAPAWAVYDVVGLVVFAEDALFIGFVIPGETAAVLGGVAAARGQVAPVGICAAVVLAAVTGDTVGYEVGRHLGPRLLRSSRLDRRRDGIQRAQALLAKRGGGAIFLGRFVAFFRAVMPALAGASRMPCPRFLAFNAAGGLCWGLVAVLLGYLSGNSYARIKNVIGRDVASVAIAVITIAGLITWTVHRHRAQDSTEE